MIAKRLIKVALDYQNQQYAFDILYDYLTEAYDRTIVADDRKVDHLGYVMLTRSEMAISAKYARDLHRFFLTYNIIVHSGSRSYEDLCKAYNSIFGSVKEALK